MTDESFALIRRVYAAINAGNIESIFDLMAPDVEWVNPPYAIEPGTRIGHEGFAKAVENVRSNFPDFEYTIEAMNHHGDDVVVTAKFRGNSEASGELSINRYHVWTLRDGKISRFRWFSNEQEALEAAEPADPAAP
jgi:ketosteroid isomerase-like protein